MIVRKEKKGEQIIGHNFKMKKQRDIKNRKIAIIITSVSIVILTIVSAIKIYTYIDIRTRALVENPESQISSPKIYDRNGKVMFELLISDEKYRSYTSINEINPRFIESFIAIEDQSFYSNIGINIKRTVYCLFSTIFSKTNCGASTITQQYVKLAFENYSRNLIYKIQEILIAINISRYLPKEQIIERYLNTVYFGDLNYGVEAASQYYFSAANTDLSLAQCAFLAAIPNSPARYDPYENFAETKARQEIILRELFELEIIAGNEYNGAISEKIELKEGGREILAPHVTQNFVKMQNSDIKLTIDSDIQEIFENELYDSIESFRDRRVDNAAAVMIHVKTGEVLAMAGSYDYFASDIGGKFNAATALRQPGSTLKPFIYALALEKGVTASTLIEDKEQIFKIDYEEYKPRNFDLSEHGYVTVRNALGSSLNIPAVKVLEYISLPVFYDFANKVGLEEIPSQQADLSVALGGAGVSLLDLTNAYRVFPNGGDYPGDPKLILDAEFVDSSELEEQSKSRVFGQSSNEISFIISDILGDSEARRLTFGSRSPLLTKNVSYVKSGTSNDFVDTWTLGYNGEFVIGVWAGNSDSSPMEGVSSVDSASIIWNKIYDRAFEYYENNYCGDEKCDFLIEKPYNVLEIPVCSVDSLPFDGPSCGGYRFSEYYFEPYLPGKERVIKSISVSDLNYY